MSWEDTKMENKITLNGTRKCKICGAIIHYVLGGNEDGACFECLEDVASTDEN